ncbi:MAG: hypothetical protein Q9209_003996 [Squamulea sp. 1 TL-2023]
MFGQLLQAILPYVQAVIEQRLLILKDHYNVFLGDYSYTGTQAEEFDSAIRQVLTRNTPTVLKSFTAEIDYAIQNNVGGCKDWTPVTIQKAFSRIASILSGRSCVGLPLSRDEDWIEATVNYTGDVSRVGWFCDSSRGPSILTNVRKLAPLLAAKQSSKKSEKDSPGGEMIDWFMSQYKQPLTVEQLGRDQLLATFASIYNLSNALSYVPFDLAAADPRVLEELREELDEVLGQDNTINKPNIANLRKLDSFARESQRLNPPSLGTQVETARAMISIKIHDHQPYYPKFYPNPDKFDPWRFYNLRQRPGEELKYQHSTTGTNNINFGHGLWACPGRFFAAAEIKVVAAYILTHYDLRLLPGQEKPPQQHWGLTVLPNPESQLLFGKRST